MVVFRGKLFFWRGGVGAGWAGGVGDLFVFFKLGLFFFTGAGHLVGWLVGRSVGRLAGRIPGITSLT